MGQLGGSLDVVGEWKKNDEIFHWITFLIIYKIQIHREISLLLRFFESANFFKSKNINFAKTGGIVWNYILPTRR